MRVNTPENQLLSQDFTSQGDTLFKDIRKKKYSDSRKRELLSQVEKLYSKAIDRDDNNFMAVIKLSRLYEFIGEPYKGIALLDSLTRRYPEKIEPLLELGRIYFQLEKYHESILELNKALQININDYNAWLLKAKSLLNIGNDINLALECFLKASELDPDKIEPHFNIGTIYERLDNPRLAKKSFERVLDININHPEAKIKLAKYLKEEGFDEKAKEFADDGGKIIEEKINEVSLQKDFNNQFSSYRRKKEILETYEKLFQSVNEDYDSEHFRSARNKIEEISIEIANIEENALNDQIEIEFPEYQNLDKVRRSFLAISIITIFISYFRLIPKEFSYFKLKFDIPQQKGMLVFMFFIIVYYIILFCFHNYRNKKLKDKKSSLFSERFVTSYILDTLSDLKKDQIKSGWFNHILEIWLPILLGAISLICLVYYSLTFPDKV